MLTVTAIVNPSENLEFADIEANFIKRLVSSDWWAEKRGRQATLPAALEALSNKNYWLFSYHGRFDWKYPPYSGLQMRGTRT